MLAIVGILAWYASGLYGSWWGMTTLNKRYPELRQDRLLERPFFYGVLALAGPINWLTAWAALAVFSGPVKGH